MEDYMFSKDGRKIQVAFKKGLELSQAEYMLTTEFISLFGKKLYDKISDEQRLALVDLFEYFFVVVSFPREDYDVVYIDYVGNEVTDDLMNAINKTMDSQKNLIDLLVEEGEEAVLH